MSKKQRGAVQLSDQAVTWVIAIVMSAISGALGVFATYVNMTERIAVMETSIVFIKDAVDRIEDKLDERTP